jgi:hypothetical protein
MHRARHRRVSSVFPVSTTERARLPFRCASDASVILGAHDGIESWTVHLHAQRSRAEQRLVSAHERLHHELHTTSPWGFLMAIAAGQPDGTGALLWRWLAECCRVTHEVFATYFAVLLDDAHPRMLAGNSLYEGYLGIGGELREHSQRTGALPDLQVDGLLRALMAPAQLLELEPPEILTMRLADVRDSWLPDQRLAEVRSRFADSALPLPPTTAVPDDFGYASYRDKLARQLTGLGLPTMTTAEVRTWTRALFAAAEREGLGTFELVDGPRDMVNSLFDDYQREKLRLWPEPLPLVRVSPESEGWHISWLARGHEELGAHSWLVWLRGDLFRRQFAVPADMVPGSRPFLGFLAVDRTHGDPVARLWQFDHISPAVVALAFAEATRLPIVFFTTLSTILDSAESDDFRGIEPALVLIDSNFTAFLDRSREGGATLSYRIVGVDGDRNLAIFVLENSDHLGVVYLLAASLSAAEIIRTYLDRQPPAAVDFAETTAERYEPHIDALLHHLIGSFCQLDLYGGAMR